MYTLDKAAQILGVSLRTLRRLMNRYGIKSLILYTDRKRAYLRYSDMNIFVDHFTRKVDEEIRRESAKRDASQKKMPKVMPSPENPEVLLHSLADAESLLGVGKSTLRRWVAEGRVEKIIMGRRVYLAHSDVLRLADVHNRIIPQERNGEGGERGEVEGVQGGEVEQFYSLAEAALALGVSLSTVKRWVLKCEGELVRRKTGKMCVCMAHKDVVMLADLHKCGFKAEPMDIVGEMRGMKRMINAIIKDIEDIKHDFWICVERSNCLE